VAVPRRDPIATTQGCDALTVRANPSALLGAADLVEEAGVATERLATRTFTRDGTVTLTVCIRLAYVRD
jgi:hypothetical protein